MQANLLAFHASCTAAPAAKGNPAPEHPLLLALRHSMPPELVSKLLHVSALGALPDRRQQLHLLGPEAVAELQAGTDRMARLGMSLDSFVLGDGRVAAAYRDGPSLVGRKQADLLALEEEYTRKTWSAWQSRFPLLWTHSGRASRELPLGEVHRAAL